MKKNCDRCRKEFHQEDLTWYGYVGGKRYYYCTDCDAILIQAEIAGTKAPPFKETTK